MQNTSKSAWKNLTFGKFEKPFEKYKCFNHYVIVRPCEFLEIVKNRSPCNLDVEFYGNKQDCITTMGNGADNTAILYKEFFADESFVKWVASSRWSFGSNSARGSIETMTIEKTHPTLEHT